VPTEQPRLVVLNGGSSSGVSTLVRRLQDLLPDPWLASGVDGFVEALPPRMQGDDGGITFGENGEVGVGSQFRELEAQWAAGVVATVRAGGRVLVDDVFLGGARSQQRWRDAIGDLPVLWVGVHCDAAVAADRERGRGDRTAGMAALQAELVHEGVAYDIEVDTSHLDAAVCARVIVGALSTARA
jgi:chloramphenicol 3-O phosphotransferase